MKRFFVLGENIGYSLSPKIHTALYQIFGDKAEYTIVDIAQKDLHVLPQLCRGVDGFNVTKPFKTEIIKYLSCDKSECASVNTVTTHDMAGYSTDGDGFLFDIERSFKGASSSDVLVLGYGGAAKACVAALKRSGATVSVTGRSQSKAEAFARDMGVSVYGGGKVDGVVSCTSETFYPKLSGGVKFCYDLRYSGQTLELDCPSANGLGMLIAQAIYSYGIFMCKQFDICQVSELYSMVKERL
ncbi:MAG: hypothetical protein E7350_05450 [Clostridiales bacterium]|nr:hypothetical protein [Clostridiales bacterium]